MRLLQKRFLLALALSSLCYGQAEKADAPKGEAPEAFIARYLDAHEDQNMLAAMRLVYLEGATDEIKKHQESSFRGDFEQKIKRVELNPVPEDFVTSYTVKGQMFTTTLPVVAVMTVEYELDPEDDTPFASVTYPVGAKDGKWWIVSARPVEGRSDEELPVTAGKAED